MVAEGSFWGKDSVVQARSAPHRVDPDMCLISTALTTVHSNTQSSIDIPAQNPIFIVALAMNIHSQKCDTWSWTCYQLHRITTMLLMAHMICCDRNFRFLSENALFKQTNKTKQNKNRPKQNSRKPHLWIKETSSICVLFYYAHSFAIWSPLYHKTCTQNQGPWPLVDPNVLPFHHFLPNPLSSVLEHPCALRSAKINTDHNFLTCFLTKTWKEKSKFMVRKCISTLFLMWSCDLLQKGETTGCDVWVQLSPAVTKRWLALIISQHVTNTSCNCITITPSV